MRQPQGSSRLLDQRFPERRQELLILASRHSRVATHASPLMRSFPGVLGRLCVALALLAAELRSVKQMLLQVGLPHACRQLPDARPRPHRALTHCTPLGISCSPSSCQQSAVAVRVSIALVLRAEAERVSIGVVLAEAVRVSIVLRA